MDFDFIKKDQQELFGIHDEAIPYISYRKIDEIKDDEGKSLFRNSFTLRKRTDGTPVSMFYHEGLSMDDVTSCNRIMAEALGTELGMRVAAHQTHTATVHLVTPEDLGSNLRLSHIDETDGLITDIPGAMLTISVADCIPLLFADPVHKAIGIAHSGRKGTMGHIGINVVKMMGQHFGTRPEDIIATIGPGICGDCYEVGNEIYDDFADDIMDRDKVFHMNEKTGKYHLDLLEGNLELLLAAGIPRENIEVSNICNHCNMDKFYSYRGDGRIINQIAASITILR